MKFRARTVAPSRICTPRVRLPGYSTIAESAGSGVDDDHHLHRPLAVRVDELVGLLVVREREPVRDQRGEIDLSLVDERDRLHPVRLLVHERADEAELAILHGAHVDHRLVAEDADYDDVGALPRDGDSLLHRLLHADAL